MLNQEQRDAIRKITIHDYSYKEKNGKPIDEDGKEFIIPHLSELKKSIFEQILKLGFSKIERVHPLKANCVIRLYQKLHYVYEDDYIYNLYGAICFTKKSGIWIHSSSSDFELNHSIYLLRHWIFQDEYIDFDCDFFDCYVKIS